MGHDHARHDALAQETKTLKMRSPLTVQTDSGDIRKPATVNTSKERTTSSRMIQNEGQVASDPNLIVSPVSSTDTFVTACEYAESTEDHSNVEEPSTTSESASLISSGPEPTSTSTPATVTATVLSEMEELTQGNEGVVLDNFANISLMRIGTQGTQNSHEKTTLSISEPQLVLEPMASSVLEMSDPQQPLESAMPVETAHGRGQSAEKTLRLEEPRSSSPITSTDDTTGKNRKTAQKQARREKRDLAIMAAIDEEDTIQKFTTDYDPSQQLNIDKNIPGKPTFNEELSDMAGAADASSTEPQNQDAVTARTRNSTDASHISEALTQFDPPASSTQATDLVSSRIVKHPQHGSLVGRSSRPGQMSTNLLSSPLLFNYDQPHAMTKCWLSSCGRPTASSDNRTVICPRCGDRSYVRYCSVTHLLADMRDHYMAVCGKRGNLLKIDESTITPVRQPDREFIRVATQEDDSGERHRQALYHAYPPESDITTSTRPAADYYIFSDADRFQATGLPFSSANLYAYRCTGSIAGRVRYQQTDPRKALFATLLERLLVMGYSAGRVNPKGCRMLFMWIKENLESQGEWTEIMITRMCLATQLEFGWRVDMDLRE